MRGSSLIVAVCLLGAACAPDPSGTDATPSSAQDAAADDSATPIARAPIGATAVVPPAPAESAGGVPISAPARLVFVGDVMLGRGVAPVVDGDPTSVFERLRPVLVGADLAMANLESPLTLGPHQRGEYALEADPDTAVLLAGAGFDVLGMANNHATDAGRGSVVDTLDALETAGLVGVGAGPSAATAREPLVVDVGSIRVGIIAFDLSGGEIATVSAAGVNPWDEDAARATVATLRREVDVVVAGVHGGVEYLPRPDPVLDHVVEVLADAGADVVWGHGAHVAYPVEIEHCGARTAVVAAGLGNALFDQTIPGTDVGLALEVLVDDAGVVAMRSGEVSIRAGRAAFAGWTAPDGDVVALDGAWWTPVRAWDPLPVRTSGWSNGNPLPPGAEQVARSVGDVTGSGERDLVLAYRRPATPHPAHETFDGVEWFDEQGRTAHLAVYTESGRMRWGSAWMLRPVGAIAVCDGSMALAFTTSDGSAVVAGGAWIWDGFGFRTAEPLPGPATPACADIDLDGRTDPLLTGRATYDLGPSP